MRIAATVAMAGTGVVVGGAAPALLPFSLVPAVALLYAARRWRGYPRWVIGAGSAAVIVGGGWG